MVACSRWYRTRPEPPSDQPWFINRVAAVTSALEPAALLASLHRLEGDFGRVRDRGPGIRNAPRTIDLDLLAYDGRVQPGDAARGEPVLPHPRLHERAFVLRPLYDLDPAWRHPVSGRDLPTLLAALPPGQVAEVVTEE